MICSLADEYLLISGEHSFLLVGRANASFGLRIETCDGEYSQSIEPDDLVAVSAPEGGPLEPAWMLAEFVRTYRIPLIVLPKGHPGSKRFPYLVSAGPVIHTSCSIQRGTHPEQHIICGSRELEGLVLKGGPGIIEISGPCEEVRTRYIKSRILTDFS